MQRNEPERRKESRRHAERDAAQVMGEQSLPGDEEDEHTEDRVPSFLTARELQARDPARDEERRREDRRKNSMGEKTAVRKQDG